MAVFTPVRDDEARAFLAEHYAIGNLQRIQGITQGVENTNFLLETDQNRFILTLFERRIGKAELPFFVSLTQHLALRGIPCPAPVAMKHGQFVGELKNKPSLVVQFLRGREVTAPEAIHCHEVGALMAKLQTAAADFKGKRVNGVGMPSWEEMIARIGNRAEEIATGLAKELADEITFLKRNWPTPHTPGLMRGVVHADLFSDNIFFENTHVSGVIDFYFACEEFWMYDAAITLGDWCMEKDGQLNKLKSHALLAGYSEMRKSHGLPVSAEEQKLFSLFCRGSALRFLLTRAVDWLFPAKEALVKAKDPREYVRKLRTHRELNGWQDYAG